MSEIMQEHDALYTRPHRTWRSAQALAAATLLVGLAGGCSSDKASADVNAGMTTAGPSTANCLAEDFGDWTAMPRDGAAASFAADRLGVSITQVANGAIVRAVCSDNIPAEVLTSGLVVILRGIPNTWPLSPRCLMTLGNVPLVTGTVVNHVGGICPAETGFRTSAVPSIS